MTPTGTLYHRAETGRENVAFIKEKEIWTYERVAAEVERLARGLVERGLRKGDRVALNMANLPELIIAYHACFRVGAIGAPLNIRFKAAELRPLLQRLRPALYIGQAALYSTRVKRRFFTDLPGRRGCLSTQLQDQFPAFFWNSSTLLLTSISESLHSN